MRRTAWIWVLSCAALLGGARASAADGGPPRKTAKLHYVRGEGADACPDEDRLRQEVRLRMGYDPFEHGTQGEVAVTISRRGHELVAAIEHRDAAGALVQQRELTSPEAQCGCWSLVSYAAVSIAFTMTPFAVPEPPAPPPPPPGCPKPDEPAALAVQFGIGGYGALGMSAPIAGGLQWFARLRVPSASIALEGRATLPSYGREGENANVEVVHGAGAIVPCGHVGWFFGCALGELGVVHLRAVDAEVDQEVTGALVRLGVRGGAELPLSAQLSVQPYADLLVVVTPTHFLVDPVSRRIWEPPSISGVFGAALTWRF